jgi:membrane protein
VLDRLRALPQRWPWLGALWAIQQRFSEVHGGFLAGSVTLAAFLSLFPLLLLMTAVVGFFSAGRPDLASDVSRELGLTGDAAQLVVDAIAAAEQNRRTASVVGIIGLLSSALGVIAALQYAYDSVWQVKGRGLTDKLYGLAWLAGAVLLFTASFALTAAIEVLPGPAWPVSIALGLLLGVALFLWTSSVLVNRDVPWRALLPGALLGAVGFEVLKAVGGIYVPQAVSRSSALYGSIGVVFALLAWLFLFGRLLVYSAVLNVVRWESAHGTDTVEVSVPSLPGVVPLTGTRAGEVDEAATAT